MNSTLQPAIDALNAAFRRDPINVERLINTECSDADGHVDPFYLLTLALEALTGERLMITCYDAKSAPDPSKIGGMIGFGLWLGDKKASPLPELQQQPVKQQSDEDSILRMKQVIAEMKAYVEKLNAEGYGLFVKAPLGGDFLQCPVTFMDAGLSVAILSDVHRTNGVILQNLLPALTNSTPVYPRHEWDRDGERCKLCGDKDWMSGHCYGRSKAESSADETTSSVAASASDSSAVGAG